MTATILKLGGSVITDKDRAETLDGRSLEQCAEAISSALEAGTLEGGLVVVHGGGSFGHHNAEAHGVTRTAGTHEAGAVADIHGAMKTLNQFVLSELLEDGVQAVPVHPFSVAHRDGSGELHLPVGQVQTLIAEGFVPVLHGDLVSQRNAGATVVSGDELITSMARSLEAGRVGLCSGVPGVLDADEGVVDRITSYEDVDAILGESDATDVTGGMAAKVQALLELESQASIFGLECLEEFLAGEPVGTTIVSE